MAKTISNVTTSSGDSVNVEVFKSVTLSEIGAVDFNDNIKSKLLVWIKNNLPYREAGTIYTYEVRENEIIYNFDVTSSYWSHDGSDLIMDEASFRAFLEDYNNATNIVISNFSLIDGRIRCGLSFDGTTSFNFNAMPITKVRNLDCLLNNIMELSMVLSKVTSTENLDNLINLTSLNFANGKLTTLDLNNLVNLTYLRISGNQLTTTEFDSMNSWALLVPHNGTILAHDNIDNFNTSITYTTLLNKGWTIHN